jgi:hypothetical protein
LNQRPPRAWAKAGLKLRTEFAIELNDRQLSDALDEFFSQNAFSGTDLERRLGGF